MSTPDPETIDREKEKLWLTDAELIRRMGAPEKIARAALRDLDKTGSGFPKKQKVWGDRRYWPAVQAYFDRVYGAQPQRSTKG